MCEKSLKTSTFPTCWSSIFPTCPQHLRASVGIDSTPPSEPLLEHWWEPRHSKGWWRPGANTGGHQLSLAAWLVNFQRFLWPWLKIWISNKTPSTWTWTFSLQIEISPTRVQQLDSGVKTFIRGKQARNKERLQARFKKLPVLQWLVKLQKRPHQISSLTHHYPNNHIQYSSIWLW